MNAVLEHIRQHRHDYQEILLEKISDYIYRDKRYSTSFAIMLMCIRGEPYPEETFDKILRKTDLYLSVDAHTKAVVFDSVRSTTYVKAAENIIYALQKEHKNEFFISAVSSENYQDDYFKMVYDLFDILEYTIEHGVSNIVMDYNLDILHP